MGYHTYESYTVCAISYNLAYNDSATYYLSPIQAVQTSTDIGRIYIPRAGTVRSVYHYWYHATQDCTAEDIAISVRKNNTSDTAFYTGSFANAAAPQTKDIGLAVSKGDYLHVKLVTPAWVTNPTGTYQCVIMEIQC